MASSELGSIILKQNFLLVKSRSGTASAPTGYTHIIRHTQTHLAVKGPLTIKLPLKRQYN